MNDWVQWHGGKCPVDLDTVVEVTMRDGTTERDRAGDYNWRHYSDDPADIVLYRVVNKSPYVPVEKAMSSMSEQVGGKHYKGLAIQPVEYIHKNGIGFCEGSAIKYLTRWRDKGGVEDLKKSRHFIDLLIEMEGAKP